MYKKEDLKIYKMIKNNRGGIFIGDEQLYPTEDISRKEKIKFIDDVSNNIATYLLNLFKKYQQEKDTLKKDKYGNINTNSKKSWIRKNDTRKFLNNDYKPGRYYLFNQEYNNMNVITPSNSYGRKLLYFNKDIVNQWYHDLITKLYYKEKEYFKTIDPHNIKLTKIRKIAEKYNLFPNNQEIYNVIYNKKDSLKDNELNKIVKTFEEIETYITNKMKIL